MKNKKTRGWDPDGGDQPLLEAGKGSRPRSADSERTRDKVKKATEGPRLRQTPGQARTHGGSAMEGPGMENRGARMGPNEVNEAGGSKYGDSSGSQGGPSVAVRPSLSELRQRGLQPLPCGIFGHFGVLSAPGKY
jgi:hypothetical protein